MTSHIFNHILLLIISKLLGPVNTQYRRCHRAWKMGNEVIWSHFGSWISQFSLCFNTLWSKDYLNRSLAQVGCMRQVLRAGALGRPRGSGWRGRWEGGLGWGSHVNPWLFHFNVWQNSLQMKKIKIKNKNKN